MIMKLLLLKKIISLIWKNNNDEHNKNFKYNNEDFLNKRLDDFYINLFVNNGFKIIHHFINLNWPEIQNLKICYIKKWFLRYILYKKIKYIWIINNRI